MRRRHLAIAVAVAAVAVMLGLRWTGTAGHPPDEPGKPGTAPRARGPFGWFDRGRPASADREATDGAAVLAGLVRTVDGQPIAGAVVAAIAARGSDDWLRLAPTAETRSADDGTFRLEVPAGRYGATATARGWAAGFAGDLHLAPGSTRDGVELVLQAAEATVRGRVEDEGGGPVPGASVRAIRHSNDEGDLFVVPADVDGVWEIGLSRGTYTFVASAHGYVPRSERITLERDATLDFRLTPASQLSGRVVDAADGKPVPFAIVRAESMERAWERQGASTEADAGGRFAFEDLEPGRYGLSARKGRLAGQRPGDVALEYLGRIADVVIEVRPARVLSGTVRARDGGAIPGARVWLLDGERMAPARLGEAETARDGTFAFEGIWPGRYVAYAAADGHAPGTGLPFAVADADVSGLEIVLEAGGTVSGRVLAGGSPVPDARVSASVRRTGRDDTWSPGRRGSATTDADGRYRIDELGEGEVTVSAEHDTAGRADPPPFALAAGGHEELDLRLEPGATVRGIVRWEDGSPAAGVYVAASGGDGVHEATTGDDGRYAIRPLRAGAHEIRARRSAAAYFVFTDRDPAVQRVEVVAGREHDGIDLVLRRADLRIEGIVVTASGAPVPDAELSAWRASTMTEQEARARTGVDGRFRLLELSAGDDYVVTATHPAFAPARTRGVAAGATDLRITLRAGATVAGRVTADDGTPVEDFSLAASGGESGGILPAREFHDVEGRFELGGLAAGTWKLTVATKDGRIGSVEGVELAAGERRDGIAIVVERGTTVRGRIVAFEGGAPLVGARVLFAAGSTSMMRSAASGEDGSFLLEGLPAGAVLLNVIGDFSRFSADTYHLVPGDERMVEAGVLRLLPRGERAPAGGPSTGMHAEWTPDGARVVGVRAASPAAEAGIGRGDELVAVDGRAVAGVGNAGLRRLVDGGPDGSTVAVTVSPASGGPSRTVTLTRRRDPP